MDGLEGPLGTTKMGAATLANLSLHSLPTRSLLLPHDLHLGRGRRGKKLLGIAQNPLKTTSKDLGGAGQYPSPFPWISSPAACRRALEGGEEGLDESNGEARGTWLAPTPCSFCALGCMVEESLGQSCLSGSRGHRVSSERSMQPPFSLSGWLGFSGSWMIILFILPLSKKVILIGFPEQSKVRDSVF